ncbi:tumor protein p53-inducible nuclear protein 2 isoform X1 [Esox lucius]|uniref:Tumor protein p53-inducible nuclear protein 2 n=1 Tax=Esox lucius TaxID=8010 RepID=A0A3P8ZHV2_ESOLU|nr:tumor protein p53-inducible nuclear protein 2 isoform X1 [Esox lucius]XP_034142950.1 tumor protein p53-inducible nuclear protein 2 isoform X1 [Esox lucius]
MFRRLTSLFFGGDEDMSTDQRTSKSSEMLEEGWLLVDHQEAVNEVTLVEEQVVECANTSTYRYSNPPVSGESEPISKTDVSGTTEDMFPSRTSELELPAQSGAGSPDRVTCGLVSVAGQLAKVTQVARVQRAQTRMERRRLTRKCIQRQNCVRQRAQRHSYSTRTVYLQQPGHRNLSR